MTIPMQFREQAIDGVNIATTSVWKVEFEGRDDGITVVIIDDVAPIIGAGGTPPEGLAVDYRMLNLVVEGVKESSAIKRIVLAGFDFSCPAGEELGPLSKMAFLVDVLSGRDVVLGKEVVDCLVERNVQRVQIALLTKAPAPELKTHFGQNHGLVHFSKLLATEDRPLFAEGAGEEQRYLVQPIVEWVTKLNGNPYLKAIHAWCAAGRAAEPLFATPNPHDIKSPPHNCWLKKIADEKLSNPPNQATNLLKDVFQYQFPLPISAVAGMFGLKGITHGVLSARLVAEVLGVAAIDCDNVGLLDQCTVLNAYQCADLARACVGFGKLAVGDGGNPWKFSVFIDPQHVTFKGTLQFTGKQDAKDAATALNMSESDRAALPGRNGPGCANRAANAVRRVATSVVFSESESVLNAELKFAFTGKIA